MYGCVHVSMHTCASLRAWQGDCASIVCAQGCTVCSSLQMFESKIQETAIFLGDSFAGTSVLYEW